VTEEQRLDDAAWCTIAEEQERERRIAEEGYLDEVEEEYRKDDTAYVKIAEEQERNRRVAEEGYLDEVEEEYRKDDKAYVKIAEEQERQRRISEEAYLDELEYEASQTDRAHTLVKEEEERQRRISFPISVNDAHFLKEIAIAAADAATKKNWVKRQTTGLRKSRNNNLKRSLEHKVWQPKQKEEVTSIPIKTGEEHKVTAPLKSNAKPFVPKLTSLEPTGEAKSIQPSTTDSKKKETTSTEEKKKLSKSEKKKAKKIAKQLQTQVPAAVEVAIPTAIQMTPVEPTIVFSNIQTVKPLEDRKEVVDRMSRELFDKIASKVLRHDTRR